jgi:hypothetical protein
MNNSSLEQRILDLLHLYIKLLESDTQGIVLAESDKNKFDELWRSIVEDLMWEPGKLIYVKNHSKTQAYKTMIDIIWKTHDSDEIFDELSSGGYSGLMVDIVSNYIDKAKVVKPIFVSVDPEISDFYVYFAEAMKSYFYGLNNSAIILSCSILEKLLKMKLSEIDDKLVYQLKTKDGKKPFILEFSLKKLINNAAKEKLITYEDRETAQNIRELRNDIVHKLTEVTNEQTFQTIIDTKDLIESLLGDKFE